MDRVEEGRSLTEAQVRDLAGGRVWLGAEALENGLADQDGGVLEALDYLLDRIGGSLDYYAQGLDTVFRVELAHTEGEEFANTIQSRLFSESNVTR